MPSMGCSRSWCGSCSLCSMRFTSADNAERAEGFQGIDSELEAGVTEPRSFDRFSLV
ncbi:hypothetical protein BDV98DRAFT_568237 [Pterulicium gracile]|uniref:Uncharacterized protein n=1 Tax=Pterulicium gracile TaxID=1884261 RepID=A0A5C3QKH3_9AGAR|nr:hypothetical protein BDV98DRAFT_568237 [Pterula gracilis]